MFELSMASPLGNLIPAFVADQPNHVSDLQPAARYRDDWRSGTQLV